MPNSGQEVYLWPGRQGNSFGAVRPHGSFGFLLVAIRKREPGNTTTKPFEAHSAKRKAIWAKKLQEREIRRLPCAAAISLNQYLDWWLADQF